MTQTDIPTSQQNSKPIKAEAPKIPVLSLEEGYAYFEGRTVPMSEAKISVATHALHYGTACFEGIRGYWNANQEQLYLLKLREHYERMATRAPVGAPELALTTCCGPCRCGERTVMNFPG